MIAVTTDGSAEATTEEIVQTIVSAMRFAAAIDKAEELGLQDVAEILATLAILPALDPKVLDVFAVLTGADA